MSTHFIDITKEHCPMTFVKVKLKLAGMEKGEFLQILLREGEPLENIPRSAQEQGSELISIALFKEDIYKVIIRK